MSNDINQSERLVPQKQVLERLQISAMTLWRWVHHSLHGFPKPIVLSKRNFWRESDLNNWIESKARAAQ